MTTRAPKTGLIVLAVSSLLMLAAAPSGPPSGPSTPPLDQEVGTDEVGTDAAPAVGDGAQPAAAQAGSGEQLVGVFAIDPGQCGDGPVTGGSYFRMVQPNGSPGSGPYVSNGDSPCGDDSYTPLEPGTDGGLATGSHQPHPDPAFGGSGNALADRITRPQAFFGTDFSTATNPTDPQTGTEVAAPQITHDGTGGLDGDLRAFAAAWNGQHFNQGSPKPDGSRPGDTAGPTGTYDPSTGRYTLEWTSRIQGGPFNGFTGVWHLEGTFEGREQPAAPGEGAAGATDGATDEAAPGTAVEAEAEADARTSSGPGDAQTGRLADTGPALPTILALPLLAAAAALAGRRRVRR